jgi:hypothetical protein
MKGLSMNGLSIQGLLIMKGLLKTGAKKCGEEYSEKGDMGGVHSPLDVEKTGSVGIVLIRLSEGVTGVANSRGSIVGPGAKSTQLPIEKGADSEQ